MIDAEGGETISASVVPDREAAITRALERALRRADLVLFSGGSSVGAKDLTPAVILGMRRSDLLVHGIRIKPVKPTVIATVGAIPVLGLPGHPVSALVVFEIFGAPLVRLLGGEPADAAFTPPLRTPARLAGAVQSTAGRDDFVRVRLEEQSDGAWIAHPLAGGSAEIASFVHADGMFRVHADATSMAAGESVVVQRFL
jgi:molybdopterin molybdotransferase